MSNKEKKEKKGLDGSLKRIKGKGKGFFGEFKAFITRGNVMDLAVGLIIGSAFTAIVTALTNKVIMPLINLIVSACTGGAGFDITTVLNGEPRLIEGVVNPKCIYIDWGILIEACINFLLVALVLFLLVKLANTIHEKNVALQNRIKEEHYKKHPEDRPVEVEEVKVETEQELLAQIRDMLKESKNNNK